MRAFIIAIICGVLISASAYVIPPLDSRINSGGPVPPLLWPIAFLSLLNVVPRIFIARIILEAFHMPEWLGEVLGVLYWPFLGAIVGMCKHWILWGVVVLVINNGLLSFLIYELSHMKITF